MAPASGEAPASAEAAASEAAEAPASAEAAEAPASGEAPASVASAEAPASAEALPRDVQQWQDDLFKELFDAPSGRETVAAADAETPVRKKAKLEDDAPAEVAISTQKAGGRKTPRAQSKATPPVDDKKRGGGGGGGGASTASQANKTKQVFANTSVATQQICRNVESNDDWAWATTCVIFLDMKKHMDEVNTLVKGSSFVLQDLKKRGYDMDKEYAKVPA